MFTPSTQANVERWLNRDRPFLIGEDWSHSASGSRIDVFNPAIGAVMGGAALADASDVDRAVRAARASFDGGAWRMMAPSARARVLWKVADLIEGNADELALLETLDNGMPLGLSTAYAVPAAAEVFRYFAGWCTKIEGSTVTPSLPGSFHCYTRKEAVGVVAMIVPWNFPFLMSCAKVAPALAAGCSCIVKPAELTPFTALRLGELLLEAGVPAGVVNIIPGNGVDAGAALVAHPMIDKITFTGSTAVGKSIVRAAAENLPKVTLELGGKSPTIILDDADIEAAASGAATSIFANSGQICVAGSRLFVASAVFDKVLEKIHGIAEAMRVGPGIALDTHMGPLISEAQLARVTGYIQGAVRAGATVVAGGEANGPGYFVRPTVITGTEPNMQIVREEIFGPVVVAERFDDIDQVLRQANDTTFGLAASVWTRDIGRAHLTAERLAAGTISINCTGASDMAIPFGGYKQSGWGRELGREGLEAYLQTKSVYAGL